MRTTIPIDALSPGSFRSTKRPERVKMEAAGIGTRARFQSLGPQADSEGTNASLSSIRVTPELSRNPLGHLKNGLRRRLDGVR